MKNIVVLVSGGGTNLQALIDAEKRGELQGGRITCVISSKEGAYALERAVLEGNFDVSDLAKTNEGLLAALANELVVALPRILIILLRHAPKFERYCLCKAVVDVVEGVVVYVKLTLPAATGCIKLNVVKLHIRTVELFKLQPLLVTLCRSKLGVVVYNMLEVVNHTSVGDEDECRFEMHIFRSGGVGTVEEVEPFPGEEFH